MSAAILSLGSGGVGPVTESERPNIVLIMPDDQGWFDLGVHGNPVIETPAMDRIAREGVSFTRFYASPVCTPTRASLLTGRHYQRTGAIDTFMGRDTMNTGEITLAEILRGEGYRTGLFGKWHLGRYMRYHPNHRGFDEFLGFWQYGFINRYDDPDELFHNGEPIITTGYITDVLTDAAIRFVRANRAEPFFLYLPYNAPHDPWLVPDPYIQKYLAKGLPLREARIYGMITSIDENIARLMAVIDEMGLDRQTLVIFMTDNGGVSRHFKAGLRGNKGSVYEGGIRVPFFLRWPGRFEAGVKIDVLAQHIDVLPTLCELVGAPVPSDRVIDGKSLLPLVRRYDTRASLGQEATGETPVPHRHHKYLFHQWNRVRPNPDENWAVHDDRFKLAKGELFDLQEDPGETTDVANEHPEKVRELREAFLEWFEDVIASQDYARVPIEVGRPDENPVEIDVTWAQAEGNLEPRYRRYIRDAIENWTRQEDAVSWDIEVMAAGRYEVTLVYGCDPEEAGSIIRVSAGDSQLDVTIQPTAGRDVFQSRAAGTIDLAAGPNSLRMHPLLIAGREVMLLHKVWLRRL